MSGNAVRLSTNMRRSWRSRFGLKPVSRSQRGTVEAAWSRQQSLSKCAICSLLVVNKWQVEAETHTSEPIDRYIDSILFNSNSVSRSSCSPLAAAGRGDEKMADDEEHEDEGGRK